MKPQLITLYRCPECDGTMECSVESLSKPYEIWRCVKCKKLMFRYELTTKKDKAGD